jgi:hypothetical protein
MLVAAEVQGDVTAVARDHDARCEQSGSLAPLLLFVGWVFREFCRGGLRQRFLFGSLTFISPTP